MEQQVKHLLRLPISINALSSNALQVCIEICEDIGLEEFTKSNLVKYIENSVHINPVNIQNEHSYKHAIQFVKAGIAYWILRTAKNTDESRAKRQEQIKRYFN